MARLVFISPYLKGGRQAAQLANRTHYMATRDGVEVLREDDPVAKRENFVDYVSHRPGVQLWGEHGLFNADGKVPVLSKVMDEVANHTGNVWTPVVSLRREDAERLGYTNAENWRSLICASLGEIAKGYKIHPEHLRWYAAFHEKERQVHVHMIVFSTDPKEGYLTKQGIRDMKSAFARRIFRQDLISVYEKQTQYRNTLQQDAEQRVSELISKMQTGVLHNEKLEQMTLELAEALRRTGGKKMYGYLPPKVKSIVDAIVEELSKDSRVAAAYELWQQMREEVCRTYSENLLPRLLLSQQNEFKPVRNMVIREALKLLEEQTVVAEDHTTDEPKESLQPTENTSTPISTPVSAPPPDVLSTEVIQKQRRSAGTAVLRMLHHMSRIFQENTAAGTAYAGLQIDRKRRKKLQEKKLAMGHKWDDHVDV